MKFLAAACVAVLLAQQPARPPRSVQPLGAEPLPVLQAERAWAGADLLLPLIADSSDPGVASAAIRAVGRLEDPHVVPTLLALKPDYQAAAAVAIAQSLKGFDPVADPALVQNAWAWLYRIGMQPIVSDGGLRLAARAVGPMGRIKYASESQLHGAEEVLRRIGVRAANDPKLSDIYNSVMRSFESLARLNSRLARLDDDSRTLLAKVIENTAPNDGTTARLYAFSALLAAGGVDPDLEKVALKDDDWQVRRLATALLGGAGAGLESDARLALVRERLEDAAPQVRYEAVTAYARRGGPAAMGCEPLTGMIGDDALHVALAALDALGDGCKDDEGITNRVIAEARTPQSTTSWHREAHAFVALAKRAPDRAALSMEAFATHVNPWVRLYAVRAAAAMNDQARLEKLAYDANANVVEAALPAMRRLKVPSADTAAVAALAHEGLQAVRAAALLLKESPPERRLFRPLATSLLRITRAQSETSRDARLALLDAIAVHVVGDDALELAPLLKDFDPRVAEKTAEIMTRATGKAAAAAPIPILRGSTEVPADLRQCALIELESGKSFRMKMLPDMAPVTVERFLKLAGDHYYDGLTIHRIVPNFVIQGGSPGANEYVGSREFMRDEVNAANVRGTVGLSTRGRNTGDAQFFVNMVDNPRLNDDYTVFAAIADNEMPVVDAIQEGDVMRRITVARCPR